MAERILVTGGAGYIGSHACKALARAGFLPVTFDDLSTGHAVAVRWGPLVRGSLMDRAALDAAFALHAPVAVMHFAALSLVGESMRDPGRYWRTNLTGALNLAEAAVAAGCPRLIFSSTAATYGDQDGVVLAEDTPQRPINAYGASKRAIEDMLADFLSAHGLAHVIFRYFNVAGADPEGEAGEDHDPETHLVPLLLDAIAGRRRELALYGTDWPTPDGTCIRDYVHVADLVDAHLAGLDWLLAGRGSRAFCLGSGRGYSVREVIAAAERVTGRRAPVVPAPRRAGDAAVLVSGSARAAAELGWRPRHGLEAMIAHAHAWALGRGRSLAAGAGA
ncbi:MAG: UDP-glucose 4-epimerase GalE [Rhodobacteraceae bacterium]|nr:UDP-glucose 4-epimerase GalE [Paracoccaceae bacterium]